MDGKLQGKNFGAAAAQKQAAGMAFGQLTVLYK
jgi:hypothetical protein